MGLATGLFITVTAFIPLAWDRYFLSLQPGLTLLAAGAAAAVFPGERVSRPKGIVAPLEL